MMVSCYLFLSCSVSRYHSYLRSAISILQLYKGDIPFSSFLKQYFAANKKYGSRDRKQISNLCYCFFRLGKAVMNVSLEEKILVALFLCSTEPNEILEGLKPEWNENIRLPISKKLLIFPSSLLIQNVFPWKDELSEGIDYEKFCESFFVQPDLFIRLRPGKEIVVKKKLHDADLTFEMISESCVALPNTSKIDTILELDKEAVIQDYSSQRTGDFIESQMSIIKPPVKLWDCCAASGGKSIMAYDINPGIELTVSDVRESILANLRKRFDNAGIKKYKYFFADLANNRSGISDANFNIILADVPCSGSGTWSRTPEQLYSFDESRINFYSSLQQKIISNVIPHLLPSGFLIYITCSVFAKENEKNVEVIKEKFHLQVMHMELLKGYNEKADSMFVSVLQKPL